MLREEWRFDGFVVSDYESVRELLAHGVAADEADAARQALKAGVDMEMVSRLFAGICPSWWRKGRSRRPPSIEAVRRILRIKFRLGLFEHPYADEAREARVLSAREHQAAAREIAGRSMVLLKNEGDVLPLKPQVRSIAVLGPLADDPDAPLGHWRGDGRVGDVVTLLAGIKARVADRPGVQVAYAKGCEIEGGSTDGFAEAVRLARQSEVAIVAVGRVVEHERRGRLAQLAGPARAASSTW